MPREPGSGLPLNPQAAGYRVASRKRARRVWDGRASASKNCVASAGGTAVPCMRTSWHLKQNAASNSARSRVSSYARMLQPGEKPQRCSSLPGRASIKVRASAA